MTERKALAEDTILAAMAANGGNLTRTAKQLGIGRTTLWRYRKLWQDQ